MMTSNEPDKLPEVDPWQPRWTEPNLVKAGRDMQGRWQPGIDSPNPTGRPPASYLDKLSDMRRVALDLLSEELTPEAWREICKKQIEKAKAGDKFATEWVTRWLEPGQSMGGQARVTPGGVIVITPVDGDYRSGLAALAPGDDDAAES